MGKELPMLELEFGRALCSTQKFVINGIQASSDDFGEKYDRSPETAEDYACGDMQFTAKPATQEVLDKYKITVDEYNAIASRLADGLSFGSCAWCV